MSLQINNRIINIATIVLAGGKGTRLFPLTLNHSKPAVSFAGKYRLIDIPLSNSLNSSIRTIFVIGQYLTAELQHHLSQTYQFDNHSPGMIDFLSPEDLPSGEKIWFEGTADAIRKNLKTILKAPVEYFLILSGDQLYNINFKKMLEFTIKKNADLTIASIPVEKQEAKRMGLLNINKDFFVTDFIEKPQEEEVFSKFLLSEESFTHAKIPYKENQFLGSMGIYIFKRNALQKLLEDDKREDFGKHLIPTEIKNKKTYAFIYNGYWEDIGTIDSFYKANIMLTKNQNFGLQTNDEHNPIYSKINYLPGSKIEETKIQNSIICEGSTVFAKEITNSIIGLRSFIKKNTIIRDSIIMGNNYYISPAHQSFLMPEKFEIGANCIIQKTIIDEHVCIGDNVQITNSKNLVNFDGDGIFVRDGITIITAGKKIPNNFIF